MGNWIRPTRSAKQRRAIYRRARKAGISWPRAARMRDWTMNHVRTAIKLSKEINNKT